MCVGGVMGLSAPDRHSEPWADGHIPTFNMASEAILESGSSQKIGKEKARGKFFLSQTWK